MSIVASLSILFGIVLGLRFSVRPLLLVCLAVIVGSLVAMVAGVASAADAALFAVAVVVALQVGYFVSMVIGAMQLAEAPEGSPSRPQHDAPRRRFETPQL